MKPTYRIKITTYADKKIKYFVQYSYLGWFWSDIIDGYCETPVYFENIQLAAEHIEKIINDSTSRKVVSITYTYPQGKP